MDIKILQFKVAYGDVDGNIGKVKTLFEKEDLIGTDVVVLPEMWTTGYDLENVDRIASRNLEPAKSIISELAVKYNVNIVAGSVANVIDDTGDVYNTAFVIDRKGRLVYQYSKIHLVPMLDVPAYVADRTASVETFEEAGRYRGLTM